MSLPRGVRYVSAPPGDGYGQSAQGYLAVLEHLGVPVEWCPVRWIDERPDSVGPDQSRFTHLIGRRVRPDTVIVHLPADRVPGHLGRDRRRLKVALTTAETDRIPDRWIDDLDAADRVIVPSAFNLDAFAATGVRRPMWVVPHLGELAVDVPPFDHPALGDRFVFYAIGPWTTRKGLVEVVQAFADAFAGSDQVALVLKTGLVDHQAERESTRPPGAPPPDADGPPVHLETWWTLAQLLAAHPDAPPVLLVTDHWDDATIGALHARGDCLVSLNRGEGFGLPVLDAARAANPVVVTGWGAPREFLGADYPLLTRYRMIATADDRVDTWMSPTPDRAWALADHDDAVDHLRWVFDHPTEARGWGTKLAARAEAHSGMEAVASALAAALDH